MYLAINYSPAAASLVKSGQINIDYFKTPNWNWMVAEAGQLRPLAIHFNLEAGNGGLDEVDWQSVKSLAAATHTPYINLHLDSRGECFPDIPVNTTRQADADRLFGQILADIGKVTMEIGAERLIVENSPFRNEPGKTLRPCVEPGMITRIIEETGCGFLLDISHAIIAAHYLGMEDEDYFYQLPVQRIKEMHFAGIHAIDGLLTDHLSIQEQDWHRLDWVLAHLQSGEWGMPWLLAFEYGGVGEPFKGRSNPEVIAEQVPLLYDHLRLLDS
jgi:uncharacterized protein (UPF0276 family)